MYIIQKRPGDQIKLGRKGEYNARRIALDLSAWQTRYGDNGTVQLIYQRPGEATPYPVTLTREGHLALWTVAAADTANSGNSGRAELRYYVDDTLVKSAISQVVVEPSLGDPIDPPSEEQQSWLDQAIQAGTDAQNSVTAAANSAQNAQTAAESAANSAQSAQISAESAATSAQGIQMAEESAAASASTAEASAQSSAAYAQTAQSAANQSTNSATVAEVAAQNAATSAQTAEISAQSAKAAAETAAASASAAEQARAALDTLVDDTVITPATIWSSEKMINYLCESTKENYFSFGTTHGGATASFNAVPNSTVSVTVDIDANQMYEDSPVPTASNPLQGWSSVSLTLTADTNTASYDFDLGGTFYGGTLDCNTGLLTVILKVQFFDGTEDWKTRSVGSAWHPIIPIDGISPNPTRYNRYNEKCSHYVFCYGEELDGRTTGICTTDEGIEIYDPSYTQKDPAAWKNWLVSLNDKGDPFHVVVRLDEPYTIQLEPAQIIAFAGTNSLRCSIAGFSVSYKQDFRYELEQIKKAIKALQS